MSFGIALEQSGDVTLLRLSGELDMATVSGFNACVDEQIRAGRRRLLVDLAALTFCDSTGIAGFVRGDNECAGHGGWLRLTGFAGRVERVLRVTGLVEVLGHRPQGDQPAVAAEH